MIETPFLFSVSDFGGKKRDWKGIAETKKAPQGRSFDDEDELISAVPPSCARGYRCKPE
ncbi:hypothetical protein CIFAM_21_00450 [Citrobacter farmeri GTC 1319]|nr:hypothetical protein CIFAM_21_00450 [Citrobacter farmeri GTC 1319]